MNLSLDSRQPFRLVADSDGPHIFGGRSLHEGIIPTGSDVPIQLVLTLDLLDTNIPLQFDASIKTLPLLYPFKYGCGGPEIQYSVRSESQIKIHFMSDPKPDDVGAQYVEVSELPKCAFRLEPFAYEEARILGFMNADAFFQPNESDRMILNHLDTANLISIGGYHPHIWDSMNTTCHNPQCQFFNERVNFETIALLPPISVCGDDVFWYEFQGAYMKFCFGLCRYCGAVFGTNISS